MKRKLKTETVTIQTCSFVWRIVLSFDLCWSNFSFAIYLPDFIVLKFSKIFQVRIFLPIARIHKQLNIYDTNCMNQTADMRYFGICTHNGGKAALGDHYEVNRDMVGIFQDEGKTMWNSIIQYQIFDIRFFLFKIEP